MRAIDRPPARDHREKQGEERGEQCAPGLGEELLGMDGGGASSGSLHQCLTIDSAAGSQHRYITTIDGTPHHHPRKVRGCIPPRGHPSGTQFDGLTRGLSRPSQQHTNRSPEPSRETM